MIEDRRGRIVFVLIVLVALVAYFAGLHIDVTRDAGKYATISKEILQNGNFINLTVHGEAYDQKPPLLFWLGALGFSIGGFSNFWFKLPLLILIFAGTYWGFRLGQSLFTKRVGILTGFLLFFSFILFLYSADIHTDSLMHVFVTLALWQLYEFIKTKKEVHWILGFTAIGLAMLSKGPLGAAIPAFAVVGHILLKKDFCLLLNVRWYLGVFLAFLVVSPALIGLWNQFGWDGIRFFFWENNVGRVTGNYVQAGVHDPVFYFHSILYLLLPWCLLFYFAAFKEFQSLWKNRFKASEYFVFSGIWIFFLILNLAKSQLPNYVFGIVPLMAVLTAKWIDIALTEIPKLLKRFIHLQFVVAMLLWLFMLVILFWLFPEQTRLMIIPVIFGVVLSIYIYIKSKNQLVRLAFPSLLAMVCFVITLNLQVLPYMFSYQAPPKAARYYNKHKGKEDRLYNFNYGQYELFFYSEPQAQQVYLKNNLEDNVEDIVGIDGNWIFTDQEGMAVLDSLAIEWDTIIEYRHLSLNRAGRFLNPKTRYENLEDMYLVKY